MQQKTSAKARFQMAFFGSKGQYKCGVREHLSRHIWYWSRGYKTFSCLTQLGIKFILLINVEMPTT